MPRRALRLALLVASLSAAACASVSASWRPHSVAAAHGQVTKRAALFYEGDIKALTEAGGELLGTYHLEGNRYADTDEFLDFARLGAAEHGGTHVMVAREGYQSQGTGYYRSGNVLVPVNVQSPEGAYVVVRVPPEHWNWLAPALRPVLLDGLEIPQITREREAEQRASK